MTGASHEGSVVRHPGFVIHSSLWFRHSSSHPTPSPQPLAPSPFSPMHDPILTPERYWQRSQFPLQALLFLLPLLVVYELALPYVGRNELNQLASDIYARRLLSRFFEAMGVTAYHLPGLLVVVVLLCWHVARRDRWEFRPRLYVGMWCESLVLALPLFVFQMVLLRQGALAATSGQGTLAATGGAYGWQAELMFALGAGIYEELLFRLIAISLLHLVLVDVLTLPHRHAVWVVVVVSAVMFGLYHFPTYNVFGWDGGQWGRFLFYTAAGVYFAVLFVFRGFGLVAGTHALYDVLVVLLELGRQYQRG